MNNLSVIIICKNEERVIEDTLKSVAGWATEIIVFDSGSTDKTVEIANKCTPKVYVTDWPGYGAQKNRALDKASCDWILSIDADEVVSEKLKDEISEAIDGNNPAVGYRIPVKLLYFGKYIRSLLKHRPLILFRRGYGRFSEPFVHEAVKLRGPVSSLKNYIFHNSYESLPHQISKLNKYAELWSIEKIEKSTKQPILLSAFTHSFWALFKDLFLTLSILDGWRGMLLAAVHAQYTFNKYAYYVVLYEQKMIKK